MPQILAAVIIIVGTALGIVAWQQSQPAPDLLLAHIVIGSLVFAFAMLQAGTALLARPRKDTKHRWDTASEVLPATSNCGCGEPRPHVEVMDQRAFAHKLGLPEGFMTQR